VAGHKKERNRMSDREFVRDALAEYAESRMGEEANMWPAIRQMVAEQETISTAGSVDAFHSRGTASGESLAQGRPQVRERVTRGGGGRLERTPLGRLSLATIATLLLVAGGLGLLVGRPILNSGDPPVTVLACPVVPSPTALTVGSISATGGMSVPRSCHSATLLASGKVLVAGGMEREGMLTRSAELYDPSTGTFSPTGEMVGYHVCGGAALLPGGKVLVAGSFDDTRAELYDPSTGTFASTGSMTSRRSGFTTTLLKSGKVLITGGYDGQLLSSAELYDPATGKFTPTGSMSTGRSAHTATLLPDGRVLVTGGGFGNMVLSSVEVYDPGAGTFSGAGNMTTARYKHAAALLPGGDVLILGGSNSDDWRGRYSSAEVYSPSAGRFTATASLNAARFKLADAVTVLADGRSFIAGGDRLVEIYDPMSRRFLDVPGLLDVARFYSTATLLKDGRVLIAGGYDNRIMSTAGAWVYSP